MERSHKPGNLPPILSRVLRPCWYLTRIVHVELDAVVTVVVSFLVVMVKAMMGE